MSDSGWQPIDSAPKALVESPNCIDLLVYYPSGHIEVMYWADGWWPSNFDADGPHSDPTHWMLLPPPPVTP